MIDWISAEEAVKKIPAGASLMVGGFMGCGSPQRLLDALVEQETQNLTVFCNDGGMLNGPDGSEYYGVAKLIHNKQVKKLYATHVGLNPEVAQQLNCGDLEVVLIPQGSMAEMIRAGGAGLGGVLTPTGLGTIVEDFEHVHSIVDVDGKKYLLERALKADYALLSGYKVDRIGNIWYKGTTRNFNETMATAAECVMVEAQNVVEVGNIAPEDIVTSGVFVDFGVKADEN